MWFGWVTLTNMVYFSEVWSRHAASLGLDLKEYLVLFYFSEVRWLTASNMNAL